MEQLGIVIKKLGTVDPTGISTEQSSIETPTGNNNQINQAYSFKVILVDKKGNQISSEMMSKSIKSLAIEVTGPSKVKVCWFISFFCCAFFTRILFRPLFLTS